MFVDDLSSDAEDEDEEEEEEEINQNDDINTNSEETKTKAKRKDTDETEQQIFPCEDCTQCFTALADLKVMFLFSLPELAN